MGVLAGTVTIFLMLRALLLSSRSAREQPSVLGASFTMCVISVAQWLVNALKMVAPFPAAKRLRPTSRTRLTTAVKPACFRAEGAEGSLRGRRSGPEALPGRSR